jgi:sarcosine oxidase
MAYDAVIIGLGGMGSAAAAHLAARGQRVLGLERFGAAHALGSSHGGSRIIRQSYFEDPAYVPLLLRAYELWSELEADSGADLMTLTGGLYFGRPDSVTVSGSVRSSQQWDLPHEVLDATELRRRFPTLMPSEDEVGLYEHAAGFVRPEATVAAHLSLATQRGADLHFDEPVLEWTTTADGGVRATTAAGTYTAGRLVICPGAWAPELLADLGLPLTVERQVMHWFQPEGGVAPFAPDRHPVWIYEGERQLYGFPAIDGPEGGAKVAFFRQGAVTTPEALDREVRPEEVQFIAEDLGRFMPSLPGRSLTAVACMYTTTPDEHFVIATHPRHEQVTIACGFSGHGFKFVPVVGEILADLATDGTTRHPIGLFDPRRPAVTS